MLPNDDSWFAGAEEETLFLGSSRFWIKIYRDLTYRQSCEITTKAYLREDGTVATEPDMGEWGLGKIKAWVKDWNLEIRGERLPYSEAAVESLTRDGAEAILQAINDYQAARKNSSGTVTRS